MKNGLKNGDAFTSGCASRGSTLVIVPSTLGLVCLDPEGRESDTGCDGGRGGGVDSGRIRAWLAEEVSS